MKYEKPEITLVAEAVVLVQGRKLTGIMDFADPQNPIRSTSAYESDE
jgi:hypothetical protein